MYLSSPAWYVRCPLVVIRPGRKRNNFSFNFSLKNKSQWSVSLVNLVNKCTSFCRWKEGRIGRWFYHHGTGLASIGEEQDKEAKEVEMEEKQEDVKKEMEVVDEWLPAA